MLALHLSVSVTGHRTWHSHDSTPPEHIPRQVRRVLEVVRAEATAIPQAHPAIFSPAPCLRVISCLSEGADRLVARAGLALGYRLGAILPFPRQSPVHARDLEPDQRTASRTELHGLLDEAESVLELAPDYVEDPEANQTLARAQRQQAYTEAGVRMLEHSDVLLAIWHGEPQPTPGSTASMVKRAMQLGMPVVWIHAVRDVPPILYTRNAAGNTLAQPLDDPAFTPLRAALTKFAPPRLGTDNCRAPKSADATVHPHLKACLDDMARETLPKPFWYSWWERFFVRLAPPKAAAKPASRTPRQGSFSTLARYYGNLHRAFFLIACLLGTLAVCVAVAALALPAFNWHGITQGGVKVSLGLLELALLVLLGHVHNTSRREDWQRKFTDYRLIAEHLRHAEFLQGLGLVVDELPSLPYYADNPANWVHWYIRARVRQDYPLPSLSLAEEAHVRQQKQRLFVHWLVAQQSYHTKNAKRSQRAEHHLHQLAEWLFLITGGCVVAHLVLKISCIIMGIEHPSPVPSAFITLLGVLTILLPLWGMAAHALGQYAEFRRLHDRSKAMSRQLTLLCVRMRAACTPDDIAQVAREASSLMLHEAVEWRVQYKMPQIAKA